MTLEVRDLRLVRAVAEHGTLTRAGTALHLTQSALSHQLADLERRLGTPLFARLGKRMVLTPAGERLRDSARSILRALTEAEEDLRATASERTAILRLSTECYTCYHWLPPVLLDFRERYPTVETRIVAEATRRPVTALLRGDVDVAIVSDPVRDRRVRLAPLFRDELVAVISPHHPWASRRSIDAVDFAHEHLILHSMHRSESTLFREVLEPAGVEPKQLSNVQLTEAIIELVKAELGVAVLARWAVAPHVQTGSLATVRVGAEGIQRQWSAASLAYKETPEHLAAFIALLARSAFPRPVVVKRRSA